MFNFNHIDTRTQPVFQAPMFPPKVWTLAALRQHLQAALMVELHTIPLYLFAMYSIDTEPTPNNNKADEQAARKAIRKIVIQEMLHLVLAGNILTAVGGRPQLYGEPFVPKYPSEILYEGVLMTLAPANQAQVENFLEQPVEDKLDVASISNEKSETTWAIPQYNSIGQFYQEIENGFRALDAQKIEVFDKNSVKRQWGPNDGFQKEIAVIEDLDTALKKLELIVVQGEGGPPNPEKPDEDSHYAKFLELSKKNLAVHKLVPNPRTKNFEGKELTHPVVLAFDAAYSYLLWTLEAVWSYGGQNDTTRASLKANVRPLMDKVMAPLAELLVKQNLKTIKKKNAAPPFNLHVFHLDESPLKQLNDIIHDAVKAYPTELVDLTDAAKHLCDLGDV